MKDAEDNDGFDGFSSGLLGDRVREHKYTNQKDS